MRGEMVVQALDDQLFAGAVGLRYQIVGTLQLKTNAPPREFGNASARFARNFGGCLNETFQEGANS